MWFNGNPITHHGIDCGDGYVIEFQGYDRGGKIARVTLHEFSNRRDVKIKYYETRAIDDSDIVVKRAKELLDQKKAEDILGQKEYCVFFNNCEHFATYCKTGLKESEQIKFFIKNGINIIKSQSRVIEKSVFKGATTTVTQGVVTKATTQAVTKAVVKSPVSKLLINTGLKQAPKIATTTGRIAGGAVGVAGLATGFATDWVIEKTLKDDTSLSQSERDARKNGRIAGQVGTTTGAVVGGVIGGTMGGIGAIVAGAALAPIALGGLAAFGIYKMSQKDQ